MRDNYTFDSEAFLATLAALSSRFEQVVASSALSFDGIDDDAANPIQHPERHGDGIAPACAAPGDAVDAVDATADSDGDADQSFDGRGGVRERMRNSEGKVDARILELAAQLFGGTCWASLIGVASLGFDDAVAETARAFMLQTARCVRRNGLAVWLHGIIADASSAKLLGKPSPMMPMTIRPMSRIQMHRWVSSDAAHRYGSHKQRLEDVDEYRKQAYRLAAYSLLRWGSPVDECNRIASLMLSDPKFGVSMLRQDPNLLLQGVAPDRRVNRALAYLRHLRVQADLYYARAVQRHWDLPQLDPANHTEATASMDRRYLYDAHRLVVSYRALWDREVPKADAVLAEVMRTQEYPRMKLWENPVYLRDVARSLVGASLSADLVEGFEARDVQRFEAGVARLRTVAKMVETMTLLLMPIALSDSHEPKWAQMNRGGYRSRTQAWRLYCDVGADLALIVLGRIDRGDDRYRADAASALMQLDVQAYCEMTIPLFQPQSQDDVAAMDGAVMPDGAGRPDGTVGSDDVVQPEDVAATDDDATAREAIGTSLGEITTVHRAGERERVDVVA
ncbi:hypothetical protein [Bifidobacterium castoris]|uniref:Riboflavin deaminase n=1 Tax=Bifidobacterium castoris TaxID=2306972 RepID=A0A430F686_9BIFI|nr:hypothetical protein [Bifidobacterium castoris]RSX46855.1 riboflavin deaminase [Bifidobacterium castoris]